jgi:hypothetical protein
VVFSLRYGPDSELSSLRWSLYKRMSEPERPSGCDGQETEMKLHREFNPSRLVRGHSHYLLNYSQRVIINVVLTLINVFKIIYVCLDHVWFD